MRRLMFGIVIMMVVMLGLTPRAGAAIPTGERQALVALYNSTHGSGWYVNVNWLGAVGTECSWSGVYCDAGQTTVTSLGLALNNLVGPLPSSLGNLTNATDLEININQLSGSIPTSVGNLTKLLYLDLDNNKLSGSIPSTIGNLTKLINLDLSVNQLSGPIPSQLGNLTALQYLHLEENKLSGAVPTSLTNLTNLATHLSDIRYNALYSTDASLTTFLESKSYQWQASQTIAPTGVAAGATTASSVTLSWTPIAFTGDTGGYQAHYSTTSGGPYTFDGITANKSATFIVVGGLNPGTTYYFMIRTVTNGGSHNQNTVTSDPSAEVHATTSGGACTSPSITSQPQGHSIQSGQTATISVAATGTTPLSYQWYQGSSGTTSNPVGTNASSFTSPVLTSTTSYWVEVSNSCGHADSVTVTVTVGATPAFVVWVPVASHNPGKNQSQWRSDLGLLNTGSITANVQITFYGSGGIVSTTTYVPAKTQSILVDVVNQIPASNSGALEIISDQPLKVTARSYNLVSSTAICYPNGTQGQDYPALVTSDGLAATQSAYLPGLSESSTYRCNIGVVNTGTGSATVLMELFDGAGTKLTEYPVTLNPGEWKQETQPFFSKAGQTAMDRGYAKITVQSGSGVFGFASVVDGMTNDPTTVSMQR